MLSSRNRILRYLITAALLLFILSHSQSLYAKSLAIGVSGGDDRNMDVDRWRKKNIEEACKKFTQIGVEKCDKAFTKGELKQHVTDAVKELKCGDTLFLFFNGHGSKKIFDGNRTRKKKAFVFDKEPSRSPDRFLTPEELLEWLEGLECCVKIYIAFHSCYSGDIGTKLMEDKHVAVMVTSSGIGQKSHKKPGYNNVVGGYVNWRNWPDGFVDGLKKGGSLAEAFQRAALEGKKDAEREGGNKDKNYKDEPLDFKRGHIEKIERTTGGIKVTLRVGKGTVVVIIPKGKATTLKGLSTNELAKCYDVEIGGKADFDDETFKPKKLNRKTPVVRILGFSGKFHVIEVVDKKKKKVKVYFYDPPGLRGETRTVTLDKLPDDIKPCNWYTFKAEVSRENVVSASGLKKSTPEPYELEVHILEADLDNGEVTVEIKKPPHLAGKRKKLKLKAGQKFPKWMNPCILINLEGMITDDAITNAGKIDVQTESFRGHVKSVDLETGEIEIDKIESPDRFKGKTKKLKVDPKSIPEGVVPCKTVVFSGKSYGEEVRDITNLNLVAD